MSPITLLTRKEAGELLLSSRGLTWLLAVALALSAFGLLLVSDTELSLLDNAQVVYDMTGSLTALGALLAVVGGIDAIAGERERGSLVPLLLAPISRTGILFGKLGGQVIVWSVMLAIAIPYLWALGSTGQNLLDGILALALLGTPVVLGFGFFAMGLASRLGSDRVEQAPDGRLPQARAKQQWARRDEKHDQSGNQAAPGRRPQRLRRCDHRLADDRRPDRPPRPDLALAGARTLVRGDRLPQTLTRRRLN